MKWNLRLIWALKLLLLSIISYSQSPLKGKYCNESAWHIECFEFTSDSTFSYYEASCLGASTGNGIYKMSNKQIHLQYNLEDSVVIAKHNLTENKQENDSIRFLNIQVLRTLDSLPISSAIVRLKSSEKGIIEEVITNNKGESKLRLTKENWLIVFGEKSGQNRPYVVPMLSNKQDIELKVYLAPGNQKRLLTEKFNHSASIKKISRRGFKLKKVKSGKYITYKKKAKKH